MSKKILIVDDEPDELRVLTDILKRKEYEVIGASTAEEALEKARQEKPYLVLLDTVLPDMDGIEVCRQLKQVEKLATKVIVYTGKIDAVEVTKARLAGADEYEVKTQDCAKLLAAVKKFISEERERVKKRVSKTGGRVSIIKKRRIR